MTSFAILLPYPPSANRLVRHTRSGHYPSKPYMDWKIEADRYLLVQKADGLTLPPEPWADVVNVETRLNPPDLWHRQCLAHLGQPTERRKKHSLN